MSVSLAFILVGKDNILSSKNDNIPDLVSGAEFFNNL